MNKLVLLALALAGCAGQQLPADPSKMSAEQIKAMAADRNASVSCGIGSGPWGKAVMTFVTLDKGIVVNGTVTVDNECKVTIVNDQRAKP